MRPTTNRQPARSRRAPRSARLASTSRTCPHFERLELRALLSGLDAPCLSEPGEYALEMSQFEAEPTLDARRVEAEPMLGGSGEDYLSDEDRPRWDDEPEGEPVSEQPGEGETGGPPAVDPPSTPPPSAPNHQPPVPGSQLPPVAVPTGTGTVVVLPGTAIVQPAGAPGPSAGTDGFLIDENHGRWETRAEDDSDLATGRWLARSVGASDPLGDTNGAPLASRTGRTAGLADDQQETDAVDESFEDPLFLAELASLDGSELAMRLTAPGRVRSVQYVSAVDEPRDASPTRAMGTPANTERATMETAQAGQARHDGEPLRVSVPAGRGEATLIVSADATSQLRELSYDDSGANAPAITAWKHAGPIRTGSVLYLRTDGTPSGFQQLEVALPVTAEKTALETAHRSAEIGSELGG